MLALTFLAMVEYSTPRQRVSLEPETGHCFAVLAVENWIGVYNATETIETQHGPVSVKYTTTQPSALNDPGSADHAEIVALPDGVAASPMEMDIMEMETGRICLVKYFGG